MTAIINICRVDFGRDENTAHTRFFSIVAAKATRLKLMLFTISQRSSGYYGLHQPNKGDRCKAHSDDSLHTPLQIDVVHNIQRSSGYYGLHQPNKGDRCKAHSDDLLHTPLYFHWPTSHTCTRFTLRCILGQSRLLPRLRHGGSALTTPDKSVVPAGHWQKRCWSSSPTPPRADWHLETGLLARQSAQACNSRWRYAIRLAGPWMEIKQYIPVILCWVHLPCPFELGCPSVQTAPQADSQKVAWLEVDMYPEIPANEPHNEAATTGGEWGIRKQYQSHSMCSHCGPSREPVAAHVVMHESKAVED